VDNSPFHPNQPTTSSMPIKTYTQNKKHTENNNKTAIEAEERRENENLT
jgi:hypothetical protein